jgi:predicted outer membrane protein
MKITLKQTLVLLTLSLSANSAPAQDQNPNGQSMPPAADSTMPVTPQHFVWEAATIDLKEIQAGELALQKSDNADVKAFAEHMISNHKKACKKLKAIAEKEGLKFPDTNSLAMTMDDHWNGSSNWNSNREEYADTNDTVNLPQTRGNHALTNTYSSLATDTNSSSDTNTYTAAVVPRGQDSITNPVVTDSTDTNGGNYTPVNLTRGQHLATNMDNAVSPGMIHQPEVRLDMLSGAAFDRAYAAKMVKGHEQAIRKFEMASADLQDADLKKYADKMLPTLHEHLRMAQELQTKVGVESADGNNSNVNYQNR